LDHLATASPGLSEADRLAFLARFLADWPGMPEDAIKAILTLARTPGIAKAIGQAIEALAGTAKGGRP